MSIIFHFLATQLTFDKSFNPHTGDGGYFTPSTEFVIVRKLADKIDQRFLETLLQILRRTGPAAIQDIAYNNCPLTAGALTGQPAGKRKRLCGAQLH